MYIKCLHGLANGRGCCETTKQQRFSVGTGIDLDQSGGPLRADTGAVVPNAVRLEENELWTHWSGAEWMAP
jgi:hypothetical protein